MDYIVHVYITATHSFSLQIMLGPLKILILPQVGFTKKLYMYIDTCILQYVCKHMKFHDHPLYKKYAHECSQGQSH